MSISILGMHRSGTSMITDLLSRCGVDLGPDDDLLEATTENAGGYFERRSVMLVDEHVLGAFGGSWDDPPALPDGWVDSPQLDVARDAARTVAATFPTDREWAFKDPRVSLVLPFWESVLGQRSSVVACIRNPLDVARSLERRGQMSLHLACRLWQRYTTASLALLEDGRTGVVTHYDAYFHDAAAELRRVCEALGLNVDDAVLARAADGASAGQRHSSHSLMDLLVSPVSDEIVATYIDACVLAGPVYADLAAGGSVVWEPDSSTSTLEQVAAWRAERPRPGAVFGLDLQRDVGASANDAATPVEVGRWLEPARLPDMTGPADGTAVRASVVVPLYGQLELTRRCIAAIAAAGWDERDELILLDNASPDGTGGWLDDIERAGAARVVRNAVNRNFAGGCNDGAAAARGDVLVFLNSDTEVRPGWLGALLDQFDEPDVEVAGGLLVYPDTSVQHAGITLERVAFPRHLALGMPSTLPACRRDYDVQAVTGALLAIRRSTFVELGGFDEAYRNGCEDLDLCWRVRERGGRVRYTGRVATTHMESQSPGRHAHDDDNARMLWERWHGRVYADVVFGEEPIQLGRRDRPWSESPVRTAVVVPLYGNLDLSRRCVESLLVSTKDREDVDIVLVDNASPDASRDWLRSIADVARTILMPRNENFAGACQTGWMRTLGTNIVFLNNDTVVEPGWLEPIEARLEDPATGVVGCLLTYPDGDVQHAGVLVAELPDPPEHVGVGARPDDPSVLRARELQLVTGACFALRRDTLIEVGGFDLGFVNGMEDVDLCLRVRDAGWRVWYEPTVRVVHAESRSAGRFEGAADNLERFYQRWARSLVPDGYTFAQDAEDDLPQLPAPSEGLAVVDLRAHPSPQVGAEIAGRLDRAVVAAAGAGQAGGPSTDARVLLGRVNEQLAQRVASHVLVLLDAPGTHPVPLPPTLDPERATLLAGPGWVGLVVPTAAVDAVGGIDLALAVRIEGLIADWMDRMRLYGWAVDDFCAGAFGMPQPWRTVTIPGVEDSLDVKARWGHISHRRRDPVLPAPLVTGPPTGATPEYSHRGSSVLLLHDDDATALERGATQLFEQLGDATDVTVVVRVTPGDASGVLPALERAADATDTPIDIVVLDGGPELDVELADGADRVVVAASAAGMARTRSIAQAAAARRRAHARTQRTEAVAP